MGQSVPNPGPQVVDTPQERGIALVVGQGSIGRHDTVPARDGQDAVDLVAAAMQGQAALDAHLAGLGPPWAGYWASLTSAEQAGVRAGLVQLRHLAHALVAAGV